MSIAIGLMGTSLTLLGVMFAYIFRSNGKMQSQMMAALERIEQGQKEIAQMLFNQTKILETIGARLASGG